jgi:bifunctional non-homologous end joining protein LigD
MSEATLKYGAMHPTFKVPFWKPMLAHDGGIHSEGYTVERKIDGTRAFLYILGERIAIIGARRWANDYTAKHREIVADARKLPFSDAIFDGELAFFDNDGTDVFLTATANSDTRKNLTPVLNLFDVLSLDGTNMMEYTIENRRRILEAAIPKGLKHIRVTEMFPGSRARKLFEEMKKVDGEGIVLKKTGTQYVPDYRGSWIKKKVHRSTDCAVIGITQGTGRRNGDFGALILAQYGEDGLQYVGNSNVADDKERLALYKMITTLPEVNYEGFEQEAIRLVAPEIVVEIRYTKRTDNGILRHPVFLRRRDDKAPEDAIVEDRIYDED